MPDHGIVAWLAVGFVAGTLAKFISGGWDAAGYIGLLAVGIIGALVAGWAWTVFSDFGSDNGVDSIAAFGGALMALWACSTLMPRRR